MKRSFWEIIFMNTEINTSKILLQFLLKFLFLLRVKIYFYESISCLIWNIRIVFLQEKVMLFDINVKSQELSF